MNMFIRFVYVFHLKNEFPVPTEVYRAVGQHINVSNMIGLQRVRGLWRIYLDNQEERELLLTLVLLLTVCEVVIDV
jgi:hypothetical protein